MSVNCSRRRVVITGLGVVCPLGLSLKTVWPALVAGKSGISLINDFDTSQHSCRFAGLVPGFNPAELGISVAEARRMDLFIQYGLVAGQEAMADAGLTSLENEEQSVRAGCVVGAGIGGLGTITHYHHILENEGPKRVSPFFIPGSIVNMTAGHLAMRYNLKGPNLAVATACTTGTHSIGLAARTIAYGDADLMLAGGSEKASTALGMAGFSAARALSTRNDAPEKASRPWDKERDGFVLGDGAGIMVLEEYEAAKARGARIYAELKGVGMSADAYHITKPSGSGAVCSMQAALRDAALNPEDLQYINAHGTSTPIGDLEETRAIQQTFGDHAYRLAVSSTKSMTGHLLGAAGAVEAIFSVLTMYHQIVPPTINLEYPDPECDLDYVPLTARDMPIKACLSNSFGFGGTNGSLLFTAL
jgi:3-oxoacyl-[acyl-carrier-protein] synthase II